MSAGFEIGAKPIAAGVVEAVLSRKLDELEPQLTRNGYDLRSLVERFDACWRWCESVDFRRCSVEAVSRGGRFWLAHQQC